MTRWALRVSLIVVLIGSGWSLGRAQSPAPDFEIRVTASVGETIIDCVKGCTLVWSERGINPNSVPQRQFKYGCGGATAPMTCPSGRIAGWVER
jgi:hypothetical protein